MIKKNKIIVSIVGITIVMLALLGITYAYYLTRIEGNTNTNSISVTTADLKLSYSDGNEIVTENNIVPGTTIGEKTFTVSNTGNSLIEDYKVVLEYAVIENVVPSVFVRPQDFEITLTCVSKNIETNEVSGTCSGYTGTWNNESFEMTLNDIAENIKHEYSLAIFYANPDIDQSDDMGKNLNLKVQIYGSNETSTITGTINNVDETYAIKLNSNPKISTIKKVIDSEGNIKYQYKFVGVENDEHTLTLVNKNDSVQSTGNITINKGPNANISGSTITVKDNQTNIFLTTTSGSSSLTSTATFNPYSNNTNSLAYHIINNAQTNKNQTIFVNSPLTRPGMETNGVYSYSTTGKERINATRTLDITNYINDIWYYYDQYKIDEETGEFTLLGKHSCIYNSCYNDLVNKYLYSDFAEDNIDENNHLDKKTNIIRIYKVAETSLSTIKYFTIFNVPLESEKVVSSTTDDYGISYYYRGGVEDNYVNFAGMCWRIVRIQGDGSIKIILEDKKEQCNDKEGNDLNNNGTYFTGNFKLLYGNYGFDSTGTSSSGSILYKKNYLKPVTNPNTSMIKVFYDFQEKELKNYISKLKSGDWCLGDKAYKRIGVQNSYTYTSIEDISSNYLSKKSFFYDGYTRLVGGNANGYQPTLKCNGTKLSDFENVIIGDTVITKAVPMYVSALTADELVYAGGKNGGRINYNYYLTNNYSIWGDFYWPLLSPALFYSSEDGDWIFAVHRHGRLYADGVHRIYVLRPAITLKSGISINGGDGTQLNPYIIEE